jgi:Uncharacterized conserved protein related to C-terminal domain of eukaryotic chaperone, SACSIN
MAKFTLDSAKGDHERGDYNWSCFKCHQACEFVVKGLFYGLGLEALGHSITRLLKKIKEVSIYIDEEMIDSAAIFR